MPALEALLAFAHDLWTTFHLPPSESLRMCQVETDAEECYRLKDLEHACRQQSGTGSLCERQRSTRLVGLLPPSQSLASTGGSSFTQNFTRCVSMYTAGLAMQLVSWIPLQQDVNSVCPGALLRCRLRQFSRECQAASATQQILWMPAGCTVEMLLPERQWQSALWAGRASAYRTNLCSL